MENAFKIALFYLFQTDVEDKVIEDHSAEIFIAEVKDDDVAVFAVVIEKQILKKTFEKLLDAVAYLFATMWVFNLKYPKEASPLWDFTEKFLLGIDSGNLSMRLLNLKVKYSL